MSMNIVVLVTIPAQGQYYLKALAERYPELNAKLFNSRDEAKAAMADADMLFAFGASLKA